MRIYDTAINHPVFTTMVILGLVVFGAVSYRDIGVDLFPRVEFPVITVVTVLPGGDPESIEVTVTDPIEEAISSISGIKHLRSTSTENVSQVVIEFELTKSVDVAYQEVQAKLGTIRSSLPQDIEDPVVEKFDIDSAPIMALVISGDLPTAELTRIANDVVKERVQKVENVGQVRLVGGQERKMWLWLDRNKLEGYSLTVQDVAAALRSEHVELPGGRIETPSMELVVKTRAEFTSQEEFANMVVAYRNSAAIRVRDIGRVEDGLEEERSRARLNDQSAVALLVRRQSGTNTVAVAENVRAEASKLGDELRASGIRMEVVRDQSTFINHSMGEIQFHLVFGGLLAVLIVFAMLRNWRITLISACAIPTSVIATFILMNALGFTMNTMTMLALSLSIGILIDDAIVVVENIFRHTEEDMAPRQAASYGAGEIMLAALAITLSIVAVFLPVAFMEGLVGRFFFQFGLTVTFAVLTSLFVAFTLAPMLSARFLKHQRHGPIFRITEKAFTAIDAAYGRALRVSLRFRWLTVGLAFGVLLGTVFLARSLRTEFLPQEDQSEFSVRVKAPLGATLQETDVILHSIQDKLKTQGWVQYSLATIGTDQLQRVNEGSIYVRMTEKDARDLSQEQAMQWMRSELAAIDNAWCSVEPVPRVSGGGQSAAAIQLDLRGSDLSVLADLAEKVKNRLKSAEGYVDVDTSHEAGKPEVSVFVKRNEAADLGVSPASIAATVNTAVGGSDVSKFRSEGDRYDVGLRLTQVDRDDPADVGLLSVRSTNGKLVQLANVATIERQTGPVQIQRYNRQRQITVTSNLERDRKVLGEATTEIRAIMNEMDLPAGYTYAFGGQADVMAESFRNLLFALGLAVIIVYMVLASQFGSFIHPITIMVAMPLSLVGALGALIVFDMTLSIFTMIGVIMLMGLVTKNAILLVDYTNVLRKRDGLSRDEALVTAGPVRLRPILMTTLAMVFGMLPIALGSGAGSESRAPMAMAVIGGLLTSTILTLLVVPALYSILDGLRGQKVNRQEPERRVISGEHVSDHVGGNGDSREEAPPFSGRLRSE